MASSQTILKPFDTETLDSLQALSNWAGPYKKCIGVFLALALALPASQASLQGWQQGGGVGPRVAMQQPSEPGGSFNSFLLLAAVAYFFGVLKFPEVPTSRESVRIPPRPSSDPELALTGPKQAWETLKEKVGGYVKIALCATLIFPFPLQPWFYSIPFAIVTAVSFAPAPKFHGPFRFGYLKYGPQLHQVYSLLSPWWLHAAGFLYLFPSVISLFFSGSFISPVSHLLVPTISLSILGISVTVYVHTYRAYTTAVAEVAARSATALSDATVAASHSQILVRSAKGCEKQLLEVLAVTRRDATLAQSVHETDFFDCAATAWSTLGRVTAKSGEGAKLVEESLALGEDDMSDDDERDRMRQTKQVVTQTIMEHLNAAQAVVESSKRAEKQAAKGREKVLSNAMEAAQAAINMRQATGGLGEWLYEATKGVERVKGLTERAKMAVVEGEVDEAKKLIGDAITDAKRVEKEKEKIQTAEESAREILFKLLHKV